MSNRRWSEHNIVGSDHLLWFDKNVELTRAFTLAQTFCHFFHFCYFHYATPFLKKFNDGLNMKSLIKL